MRPSRLAAAAIAASLISAIAGTAGAQLPSLDVRTWRPSTDPRANLVVEPTSTPGPWAFNIGGWLSYAQNPVTLRRASTDDVAFRPVQNQLALDLTANVGLGSRAAIGASVPVILYQQGTAPLPRNVSSNGETPESGIGDIAIHGKGTLISNENQSGRAGLGLAMLGTFTLPTGDQTSFVGEGSSTVTLRALVEYAIPMGSAQASIGYRLRTERETWPTREVGGVRFGDDIPWTLGVAIQPKGFKALASLDEDDRQTWELAVRGSLPAGPVGPFGTGEPGSQSLSPVMLALSDRIGLGHYKDTYVLAGADLGLSPAVGVPAIRGVVAIGWAPRAHDKDHDGVPDDVDECPAEPEDKDRIADEDGCPEDDADEDNVPDSADACPRVKGVMWNDPKKDGCPAPDSDGDGVPDPLDACPAVKGIMSDERGKNGCPALAGDRDGDTIRDDVDKCIDQPEDKDGFQDDDGCPDPDNDGDGIMDKDDKCPDVKGVASFDPSQNGCPSLDRDDDTYANDVDKCPDEAEDFNGTNDEDGCPDQGGEPLVVESKGYVALRGPMNIGGKPEAPTLDKKSELVLRAIAKLLMAMPSATLEVAVRPLPGAKKDTRAELLAGEIGKYARHADVAHVAAWDDLKKGDSANRGIVFRLVNVNAKPSPVPVAAPPPGAAPKPAARPPGPAPVPDKGETGPKPGEPKK